MPVDELTSDIRPGGSRHGSGPVAVGRWHPAARWRCAKRGERAWWVGLFAIALLTGGSGWYTAWASPPYRANDEQAHAGYVLELHAGRLPTVDTPIDVAEGGVELRIRVAASGGPQHDVWVANNPPVAYVLAAGPAAVTRALGWTGGPLLGLRLTNLTCMVGAVVLVARLARNLSGGDQRVALVAGGLMAAIPHVGAIAGLGYTDGLGLLCSVAMVDLLTSIARRGPTRRLVAALAAWCAVGVGVRPMTAVLAAVVVAMAYGLVLLRGTVGRLWAAAVLGGPALVLNGWWYLRNQRLYGDPTGSDRLFEKFGRVSRSGPLAIVHDDVAWRETLRTLFTRRLGIPLRSEPMSWWPPVKYGLPAVLVVAAAVVAYDQISARRRHAPARTPAPAWGAGAVVVAVTALLAAQHWAGGGLVHPRYLFPALMIFVTAAALVLVRLATRWAGLALIEVFLLIQARQTARINEYYAANPLGPARSALELPIGSAVTLPIGPAWLRLLGVALMVAGAVAFVAALTLVGRGGDPSRNPGAGPQV